MWARFAVMHFELDILSKDAHKRRQLVLEVPRQVFRYVVTREDAAALGEIVSPTTIQPALSPRVLRLAEYLCTEVDEARYFTRCALPCTKPCDGIAPGPRWIILERAPSLRHVRRDRLRDDHLGQEIVLGGAAKRSAAAHLLYELGDFVEVTPVLPGKVLNTLVDVEIQAVEATGKQAFVQGVIRELDILDPVLRVLCW